MNEVKSFLLAAAYNLFTTNSSFLQPFYPVLNLGITWGKMREGVEVTKIKSISV